VSKSPAKSKAPSKKTASKPAATTSKKTPPAAKKPAATPAPKKPAPGKPAPAKKPAAKPAPKKPVAKAAPKTPAKPAPAPKPAAKPAAKAAPTAPPQKKTTSTEPVTAIATKTPTPAAPAAAKEAKPAARGAGKSSKHAAPSSPPLPDPAPASRFADRFAPMRSVRPVPMDDAPRPVVKFDPKLVNAWKGKAGRDLTEPELLAMPEAEYMNDKQLEFFRMRLTALKDDLLSNAGETTEHLREDTSIVPDPADRATIEEEHALELRTRDRERKLLKKISQSLGRIEASDYGYCDETGEPIGLARLLARPTATLSLEAQQRREMKQKMFGD
jgi:DnaK suppressor protein